jgi:hypothetical protein
LTYGIFSTPAAACHLLIACTYYTLAAAVFLGGASFSFFPLLFFPLPTLHSTTQFTVILPGAAESPPSHREFLGPSYLSFRATFTAPVDYFIAGKATKFFLPCASALVGAFSPIQLQLQFPFLPALPISPWQRACHHNT